MIKRRDPTWRFRLALGRKVVRDKTKYRRKVKHKPRHHRRGSSIQKPLEAPDGTSGRNLFPHSGVRSSRGLRLGHGRRLLALPLPLPLKRGTVAQPTGRQPKEGGDGKQPRHHEDQHQLIIAQIERQHEIAAQKAATGDRRRSYGGGAGRSPGRLQQGEAGTQGTLGPFGNLKRGRGQGILAQLQLGTGLDRRNRVVEDHGIAVAIVCRGTELHRRAGLKGGAFLLRRSRSLGDRSGQRTRRIGAGRGSLTGPAAVRGGGWLEPNPVFGGRAFRSGADSAEGETPFAPHLANRGSDDERSAN